jgi:DNA-binding transcriptional regulator YiaG
MRLGLMQSDVAEIMQVSVDCITYWENNRSKPQINYYPSIISFLGYNPFEIHTNSLSEKIFAYRCVNGLSYKAFGKLLGVDASTVRSWEVGVSMPNRTTMIVLTAKIEL